MLHEASDQHGAPVPGANKVARFTFYPQSGAKAGGLAKNIKAFVSRNKIEPSRFAGLIQLMHCCNEHDRSIQWQQNQGVDGVKELRDVLSLSPLGTVQ